MSLPAFASGALQTTTITAPNSEQSFVVPVGIVKVGIRAVGQQGESQSGMTDEVGNADLTPATDRFRTTSGHKKHR